MVVGAGAIAVHLLELAACEILKEMCIRDSHYGVPQFNINNLEWTKAVLTACEEMKSPVILGVSEGAGKYRCV